jgi:outer membrane lipoprotein carrier protein
MRSALLPWVFLVLCTPLSVGGSGLTPEAIVEKLQADYRDHRALEAEIVQIIRYIDFDVEQRSHGTIFLKKPAMMRMVIAEPQEQMIITDGDTLWIYTPADEQVLRRTLGKVERSFQPASILFGGSKAEYRFRLLDETADSTRGENEAGTAVALELTPAQENAYVDRIVLWIDCSTWRVSRLLIDTGSEANTIYEFPGGWKETSLPDTLFRFTPPAGVETFEME